MPARVSLDKEATLLRDAWQRAVEKNQWAKAADALDKLTSLEADEPRWPHRHGEMLMRLGRPKEAETAYVRAAKIYTAQGFLARAIAVVKLAAEIEPARAELLVALDQKAARELRPGARPALHVARPLEPVAGAATDEVRFEDAPESCVIEAHVTDFDMSTIAEGDLEPGDHDMDAEKLAHMSGTALFADVSREALADIAREAVRVELPDRGVVFAEGERADALLVIVEGRAQVRRAGAPGIELGEGDILGESALLEEGVRSADVRARGRLVALRVLKESLDGLVARHPQVGEVLFGLLARRLVANALETSPLFAPFDPPTRAEIARSFEVRRARPGTNLEEKGKKGDALYLALSGVIEVAGDGGPPVRLPLGSLVGHDALVARAPASRTVTVAAEAVLLRLPASKFASFATSYPPALAHLAELAAKP